MDVEVGLLLSFICSCRNKKQALEEVLVCCAGVQAALEQELLDNVFTGSCSVHDLVPPDSCVSDKGKSQLEHVVGVDVWCHIILEVLLPMPKCML